MAIHIDCVECKERMVDGSLRHKSSCSAVQPTTITSESRMPAQVISFDTEKERKDFNKKFYAKGSFTIPKAT